ncbi:hypothetical protein ACQ4PT_071193 [Festuca glaucescens]
MMLSSQIDAFSPSQFTPSQNAAADTPSKFRGASGTTPLTVKQIADAQLAGAGEKGAPFVVDGVETANIRVVGTVSGKAERATDVSFTLDDGTGRLDFIRWVNDAADSAETAAIQNGMYVSVIGTLKGLQDKKRATAFCVSASDHGVHIDEIAKRLGLPASKIKEAIDYHVDGGHIYSTIDDFHYKSAFID